jgi:nucleoside-diphosphate-sugar epimerase
MQNKKQTILVTGATGFLGKNILEAFASHENVTLIAACRDLGKLSKSFQGEVREGDLFDSSYRQSVVKGVDVICHAGTWAAMWGHAVKERDNFYQPTLDLIEQAINAGVQRFLMTSTVVIAQNARKAGRSTSTNKTDKADSVIDDFSPTQKTGFWPHVDYLVKIDEYMKNNASRGMQMVTLRLGHFVGAGNTLGLVPVLVPRLKTHLVPWLNGGKSRLPLVADTDLGNSFIAACLANDLQDYESFNICGTSFPTTREVIHYVAEKTGASTPFFSVPYSIGYLFASLMEILFPVLPGKAPFLTRSIVHLAEEWVCSTDYAQKKLNYHPQKDWRSAMDEALKELKANDYPWPYLARTSS